MVQYKAMEKGTEQAEFRWGKGDQFEKEVARMNTLLLERRKIVSGGDPDGFRFSDNPFFLKYCPRFGAHSLRATTATNALLHDADIAKVQELLGHANISTTRLYDRRKSRLEENAVFRVRY